MATYKPGQRVRSKIDGDTGTFVRYQHVAKGTFFTRANCYSRRDLDCAVVYDSTGTEFAEHTENLEPIQPERNRVVEWESLPIDPRKILEEA